MKVRIFSCHHAVSRMPMATELFQSMVTNILPPAESPVLTDLAGKPNIAPYDKFCELRHQYYVWKNLAGDFDYVGFEHYRRPFIIDPAPLDELAAKYPALFRERFRIAAHPDVSCLDTDNLAVFHDMIAQRRDMRPEAVMRVKNWIAGHDILYASPIYEPIDQNFARSVDDGPFWAALIDRLRAPAFNTGLAEYMEMPAAWSAYLNMYIMRTEIFMDYMNAILPVLLDMDERHPDMPARYFGFVAERMFGAFMLQKRMENPLRRFRPAKIFVFPRDCC